MDYDYILKLLILGDASVGKSSTLLQYTEKKFNETSSPTIGVEFGSKTIKNYEMDLKRGFFESKQVKLQIWDTSGQERFRSVAKSYYRNTAGIMLIFDVTNYQSFENIRYWLEEIEKMRGIDYYNLPGKKDSRYPVIMLLANKTDLDRSLWAVHQGEINNVLERYSLQKHYKEISAKTGEGIYLAFEQVSKEICRHIKDRGSGIEGVADPKENEGNSWYELEQYRNNRPDCCTIT